MPNLLEITGDDIALLDDADLRTLIGLLCEADYRLAGLSPKGITWGGHQDAPDGGLDVIVRSETPPPQSGFVPRCLTGFQVKKPNMTIQKIGSEMKPKGVLREEIKNLIQGNGAYIIVSSGASTTNTSLKTRVGAMKEAVAGETNCQNFHIDFFDRVRVASWVRLHPSLILWVRNKIGRELNGWHPYENWAKTPGGIEEEYLLDDGLRLYDGTRTKDQGISVEDGLQELRVILSRPGKYVRLTGLSGVGKTRLVQALFDERIGTGALNRYQSFYTDMSYSPNPAPNTFAEWLIAERKWAILIVDNCPSVLHRQLTDTCSKSISLLTVEYDVRDDLPEETNVFRLEPASDVIIEKLINKRFPHISQIDARRIAEFSSGNARVAISLANTMQKGDTLSSIRDEDLFKRLFQQRHEPNKDLLISAEACSLVYSFDGADTDSDQSELKILASLVDQSVSDLYRAVEELKKRDMVQARDVWRAVLPHAIANRLAKNALESIPKARIIHAFLHSGSERLIKSFTRRLSYLHDCNSAVEIVADWLAPDSWIGKNTSNLSTFGMEIFRNIAPVSPEKALEAIERIANGNDGNQFTSRNNSHYYEFVRLLRHFAYDPQLFNRSVNLICRYALSEKPDENRNSTRDILTSLFYIHLSGTHASVEARAKVIEELVDSEDDGKQELGLVLLDAALETWHFNSSDEFEFSARKRDFGYEPRDHKDIAHWYETYVGICTRMALSCQPIAQRSQKIFADHLRGLWTNIELFETLERSAQQIHERQAWNDGWIAVREIIRYDGKSFQKEIQNRLNNLEELLRPRDLLELARTYALSDQNRSFGLEDDFADSEDASSGWQRTQEKTREIGSLVAQDTETLNVLLPDIVSTHNLRLRSFGMGLADGSDNKAELWKLLYAQFENTPPEKRQMTVLLGFLSECAESDSVFYNSILDNLINDDLLGDSFPLFQTSGSIDSQGVERLNKALDIGKVKIETFRYLAWGRVHESISDDDLAGLLKKILTKEGGIGVAIEILRMRFYGSKDSLRNYSEELITVARNAILLFTFADAERGRSNNLDHELAGLARATLNGQGGAPTAVELCRHIAQAISNNRIYVFDYHDLLNTLARTQPFAFLDMIVGYDGIKDYQKRRMFGDHFGRRSNPVDQISDDDILSWCDDKPEERYPLIASVIQPFSESEEADGATWKPIVYSVFAKAQNLNNVLKHLASAIRPSGWSGSLANILEKRAVLFQNLFQHENEEIRSWANNQYSVLQKSIDIEREEEKQRHRRRNETFE